MNIVYYRQLDTKMICILYRSGKIKPMNNNDIIKLGSFKQMSPADPDWFFVRAASIARHLYMRAPAGVGAFSKIYGGL